MTLLTMINEAQDSLSIPRSTVVVSSTDQNVRFLLAKAQQEGRELARRYKWQDLVKEQTFTSVAQALQTNAVPSDFAYIVNHTMFNRSQTRRVTGPMSPEEWQAQQALTASLLTDSFRIQGDEIYIEPVPDAGDTYAYEYVSKNWCQSSSSTAQSAWAADSDTGILDETLMVLGLVWRFKQGRELPYAEDFNTYEREIEQAIMRDGGRRDLNYSLDDTLLDKVQPPLVVEGSWSL